jgi:hypothetical protein
MFRLGDGADMIRMGPLYVSGMMVDVYLLGADRYYLRYELF